MITIRVEIAPSYVEQVIVYLQTLPADQRGEIIIEEIPIWIQSLNKSCGEMTS